MNKLFLISAFLLVGVMAQAQERKILTSDGVELYVKVKGKGAPCLYLHGGPGSGSYWMEKFFGDFMEENFTMIYLDQRGVGRSGSPENGDFSMKRMTKDFEEIREALGYEKWLTIGHSFGGILQMGYAENYPNAQEGMLMINNTLDINDSFCNSWGPKASELLGEDYAGCANDDMDMLDRLHSLVYQLKQKDIFWKMAFAEKESEKIMDFTYSEIPNWTYDFGNVAWHYEDYKKNYLPNTTKINVPVLFFYGTKDWMVGPEHYKKVAFPNMLLWKSEVGHIPFLENKEDLKKAILSFTSKNKFSS